MKATGEVMAIDRSFEAALQKAVRSLEVGGRSLLWQDGAWGRNGEAPNEAVWRLIERPNDLRLWALMAALRHDVAVEDLHRRSGGVDPWFLRRLRRLVAMERRLLGEPLTPALLREAKRLGFSDAQVGRLADRLPEQVRRQQRDRRARRERPVDVGEDEPDAALVETFHLHVSERVAVGANIGTVLKEPDGVDDIVGADRLPVLPPRVIADAGVPDAAPPSLDGVLQQWAELTDKRLALEPGAGDELTAAPLTRRDFAQFDPTATTTTIRP